ncbi:NUDIX hydrolase [Actinomycetospora corticicola]|uniref:8-oxo-dGTP pyrophosphatase MutT (NUDIX family) n=1 Tax=Actinomycetospora corticicola TaxID=663602 RepID=A0A7Y9DZF8_9PSEU|nr:8-oxo-dGTP pyrophosphatase MutT (NUDIX family) [Actinomycetospora corticicola]
MTDRGRLEALSTRIHGERAVYTDKWVRLTLVDIEPPGGGRFEHHVVRLARVVTAAVINESDEVMLMWRHRFAVDEWGWELPGGIAEVGEEPAVTAAREFEEETGWRPIGSLRHLVSFQPMPGMVDTPHEVWTAVGAEKVGEPSDTEEAAVIEWVPLANVPDMVKRGEIAGSGPLVGLLTLLMERQGN